MTRAVGCGTACRTGCASASGHAGSAGNIRARGAAVACRRSSGSALPAARSAAVRSTAARSTAACSTARSSAAGRAAAGGRASWAAAAARGTTGGGAGRHGGGTTRCGCARRGIARTGAAGERSAKGHERSRASSDSLRVRVSQLIRRISMMNDQRRSPGLGQWVRPNFELVGHQHTFTRARIRPRIIAKFNRLHWRKVATPSFRSAPTGCFGRASDGTHRPTRGRRRLAAEPLHESTLGSTHASVNRRHRERRLLRDLLDAPTFTAS